jgi:hypothetical protein
MRFHWMQNRPQATGRRKLRRVSLSLESLEGRALLAGSPLYPISSPTPITMPTSTPITMQASPTSMHATTPTAGKTPMGHDSHASEVQHKPSGIVTKVPHFYKFYTGPKWAELNAVKASAELSPNGNFTFTGTNQGMINKAPAVYVWGIDRSGHLSAGPFTDRPNIKFDALVVVSLNSALKPTATVNDLASGTSTVLPSSSVSIHGQTVKVTLSASLLPSTGLAPSQYRFNFWPEDGGPVVSSSVASFVPEFTTAQVGTSK